MCFLCRTRILPYVKPAMKGLTCTGQSGNEKRRFFRGAVAAVEERAYSTANGRGRTEKVLVVNAAPDLRTDTGAGGADPASRGPAEPLHQTLYFQRGRDPPASPCVALLRDEWLATEVDVGDTVHLVGAWGMERAPPAALHALRTAAEPPPPAPARAASPSAAPPPAAADAVDADLWDGLDEDLWDMLDTETACAGPPLLPTMLLTSFAPAGSATNEHMLVVHPDVIVSASRLASAASCMRKPMLQERIKAATDSTEASVLGNLVHGVLQACMLGAEPDGAVCADRAETLRAPETWDRLGNFSCAFLARALAHELCEARAAMALVGADTSAVRGALLSTVPNLVAFAERFLAGRDKGGDGEDGGRERRARGGRGEQAHGAPVSDARAADDVYVRITRVLGAEEDVVSPMYGIKGRLDVVVEADVWDGPDRARSVQILPLEVKSGRVYGATEHHAQTSLYTLLLTDRYGIDISAGLLVYTQTGEVQRVPRVTKETRGLLMARNEIATYRTRLPRLPGGGDDEPAGPHKERAGPPRALPFLPRTIDDARRCGRCYARDACMLYRAAVERVDDCSSPIAPLYREHTEHLTEVDLAFFQRWDALLSHEEKGLAHVQQEFWTLPPHARERRGRCAPRLALVRTEHGPRGTLCVFRREAPGAMPLSAFFSADDAVAVATEAPAAAFLAHGRVASAATDSIAVRAEHDVDEALRQVCEWHGLAHAQRASLTFRVDTNELMAMMAVPRYNIACLFYVGAAPRTAALRARVVHLAAPQWRAHIDAHTQTLVATHAASCNEQQLAAVSSALRAEDYALVLGMPGTGKSTTIATLVKVLAAAGQRVLLCSYTHSAVDTILTKLVDDLGVDALRVGPLHRIHPRVHRYSLDARLPRTASLEEYEALVAQAPIVAATCLAAGDAALARSTFDVCIVDEASQITVPTSLGPLRYADRFVLIGDHHQLAPVVRDRGAAAHGFAESLFQRLCDAHPAAVVDLRDQYRMAPAIMALSNALVYGGRLRCGAPSLHTAALHVDVPAALRGAPASLPQGTWRAAVLAPENHVVFVDTDAFGTAEVRTDSLVANPAEAQLVGSLVHSFAAGGMSPPEIGVLTPYRQQVRVLSELLQAPCAGEVLTVDQAQGRDWDLVVVSLVRANAMGALGELLRDMRRVNVLLTRAKRKLVLVGSLSTLRADGEDAPAASKRVAAPMQQLVALLQKNGTVVAVPAQPAPAATPAVVKATCVSPSKTRPLKTSRMNPTRRVLREVWEEVGGAEGVGGGA
ncbi:DNA helicase [Malassezia sp. CBS 17886]|nr:DNA helicase [Malassezia sp. CBS 17886]